VTTSSGISDQTSPDSTKLGEWLFRHRTALPLPIAGVILGLRSGDSDPSAIVVGAGVAVTMTGELIRLWGVRHIGAISRTRSHRLGPLVATGPFAWTRNPLYIGNIMIWAGFALSARLTWLAPIVVLLLAAEYHAIVKWEESLLVSRLGAAYREYVAQVPRWLPTFSRRERKERADQNLSATSASSAVKSFSWTDTLFSERGTFVAIAVGYLLLWIKARF
jgi:protein-S-isoprenylcysteine O-methyltransferase Ste14